MNLEEYRRMYEAEERQWWYVGMRRIAFVLLDPILAKLDPGSLLLDAGCGTGHNLQELSVRGRATGVDLSPEALSFCRRRGVRAVRGDLLALPFPDATFAAVTSFDVLYHRWVRDDRAAVRCHRHRRPQRRPLPRPLRQTRRSLPILDQTLAGTRPRIQTGTRHRSRHPRPRTTVEYPGRKTYFPPSSPHIEIVVP